MKKETIYEERRMRSKGAHHYFFKESGSDAWKYHNWDGPAVAPIEGEETEHKKEYYCGVCKCPLITIRKLYQKTCPKNKW